MIKRVVFCLFLLLLGAAELLIVGTERSVLAYKAFDYKWDKTEISVYIHPTLADSWKPAIRDALNTWTAVGTGVRLVEGMSLGSDIVIRANPDILDIGPCGVACVSEILGSSDRPTIATHCEIKINTARSFSTDGDLLSFDVYSVVAHELGHCLGLDHSEDSSALMSTADMTVLESFVLGDRREITEDDGRGLLSIYGWSAPQIAGRVTNQRGGPYPGIHVYACPIPPGTCGQTTTGADGSYTVLVPNGTYRVQFGRTSEGSRPDGYWSRGGFVSRVGDATNVQVQGARSFWIDVRLPH